MNKIMHKPTGNVSTEATVSKKLVSRGMTLCRGLLHGDQTNLRQKDGAKVEIACEPSAIWEGGNIQLQQLITSS